MKQVYIEDISQYVGQEVTVKGWLYNKRSSGKIRFLLIRDGTGVIQGVLSKGDVPDEVFDLYDKLTQESSIIVKGLVRKEERSPGGYELSLREVEVVQIAENYPITPKPHGVTFLMDHRHLWFRSSRQHSILKVRSELIKACRNYFDERGYVLIDSPILTPAACEGTTTLFETDYFGEKVYLSQSGQLYLEPAAMALGKVYCFGPTFRAEKSKTRRHLLEFWMLEPEVAYAELDDIMELAEDLVCEVVHRVLEAKSKELKSLGRDLNTLERIKPPFPRISYDEGIEILKKKGVDFKWGDDFGASEEDILSECFQLPVMIHRYPSQIKAFYMERDPQRPEVALCVDMIAPEGYGEIIGGGQRATSYDYLLKRIKEENLPVEAFQWYLDIRKYGSVPHSGFGMGIERVLAWICGLKHLREAIPYPRMLYWIYP